jgi:hypothetical protein
MYESRTRPVRCEAIGLCGRLRVAMRGQAMKQRVVKSVTVRFEEPERTALQEMARRQCRTMSDEIRFIVRKAIEQHGEERAA